MLFDIRFFSYVCWESSWRISPFCIYIVAQLYSCFKIFPLVQFELSTHWFAADMSFDLFLSDSCIVTWAHCNSYPCCIQNWMVAIHQIHHYSLLSLATHYWWQLNHCLGLRNWDIFIVNTMLDVVDREQCCLHWDMWQYCHWYTILCCPVLRPENKCSKALLHDTFDLLPPSSQLSQNKVKTSFMHILICPSSQTLK